MRNVVVLCVVVCVVLSAGFASAATPGQIPQNSLSKMGLAGLQPMTDLQGESVRGSGCSACGASVNGYSFASASGAESFNQYSASSSSLAAGASVSGAVSGSFLIICGKVVFAAGSGAIAGGGAIAVAH